MTVGENTMNNESYFDGGLLQFIGWSIFGFIVTTISFGILFPWAYTMLYTWEAEHIIINGKMNDSACRLISNELNNINDRFYAIGVVFIEKGRSFSE